MLRSCGQRVRAGLSTPHPAASQEARKAWGSNPDPEIQVCAPGLCPRPGAWGLTYKGCLEPASSQDQ